MADKLIPPLPLPAGFERPKIRPVPMAAPAIDGITVSLTVSMTLPDVGTAGNYLTILRSAFAFMFPELIRIQTDIDPDGNPVYADDPDGVIERQVPRYITEVVLGAARLQADLQAAQLVQNTLDVINTVPVNGGITTS